MFVCPGATNWSRVFPNLATAIPNIRGLTREGQKKGALGELTCGLAYTPLLFLRAFLRRARFR